MSLFVFFFFKQKTAYEIRISDWSSDVCSSDLEDRHHFRFIVSPEDAGDMADLRAFTRELMDDVARDLGTDLDWVAVDHWNTDNPHIHVLLRGKADDGTDLVIDRDYIREGMRGRAEEREIGRAHVCTPVTNAHLVCRPLSEK